MTIKYNSIRMANWLGRSLAATGLGMTALFLASCGGGGTQGGDPLKVGSLALQPPAANFYAINPATIQVAGGRAPYNISASEPTLVPSNFQISGNVWNFTPNQPGVVDAGQDPNEVPSRSVTITVRDANGDQTSGTFKILQNFFVGYGLSISTTTSCTAASGSSGSGGSGSGGTTAAAVEACAGSDSLISLVPITNGLRLAGKQMRLAVNYGPYAFIQDGPPDGITGPSYTRSADSTGAVTARIRVLPSAQTQYAQFRLTDVATGAFRDFTFVVRNAAPETLSALPSTLTFTGSTTAQCGFGSASIFPLGGKSPYRAVTTNGTISLSPSQVVAGDAFNLSIAPSSTCITASVIVSDAEGKSATVTVKTEAGTAAPVFPLAVAPTSICIPNGGAGVVLVSGGNKNKVLNVSAAASLSVTPTTGTDDFTVNLNAALAVLVDTPVTVAISDGGTSVNVNVTRKVTCP